MDLKPNQLLYTRDGSRRGNALVTSVDDESAVIISDLGVTTSHLYETIAADYTVGNIADQTHPHFRKPAAMKLHSDYGLQQVYYKNKEIVGIGNLHSHAPDNADSYFEVLLGSSVVPTTIWLGPAN